MSMQDINNAISIESVVSLDTELKPKGNMLVGLCPFHDDKHIGSFIVTPATNSCYCFACGIGATDAVAYYAKAHDLSMRQATKALGDIFHIGNHGAPAVLPPPVRKPLEPKENRICDPDTLDAVYRCFVECARVANRNMNNFMKERHLSKEQMNYFFRFPNDSNEFMAGFLGSLKRAGIEESVLDHVPGFYTYDGNRRFMAYSNCVGIIFYDTKGRINAIQIRTKDPRHKYVMFSSSFADGSDGHRCNGTKRSCVADVIPGPKKQYLLCTEGKFKALALNQMGATALNLAGVQSWNPVEVEEIANYFGIGKLLLCYDSDIFTNPAVYLAAQKFVRSVEMPVEWLVWDPANGKGVDDVIHAGKSSEIKRLSGKDLKSLPYWTFDPGYIIQ